ncbi:hypothetical protein ABKN59_002366 [Abortiporus biennis]
MNSMTSVSSDTTTNIKRKFEDALHTLDEAVGQPDSYPDANGTHPPPAKKAKVVRSLYATLAKYGIKKDPKPPTNPSTNRLDNLSKTAPHLAKILSRTATKTRKVLPFKFSNHNNNSTLSATSTNAEYRPSSTQSFLTRLATFKLTTYANKPPAIDAVAASKCGWVNDGKDRLVCGICDASWVVAGKEGMSRDAANALIDKQKAQLVDMHKDGCPWKTRQCDDSIYRVPLHAPSAMAREIKLRAQKLDEVVREVQIKHPLTSTQVQHLVSTVTSVSLPEFTFTSPLPSSLSEGAIQSIPPPFEQVDPSEAAILVSLFGWSLLPPTPPSYPERLRTPSLSRAPSVASPLPSTLGPARFRAPLLSPGSDTHEPSTPTPSPKRSILHRRSETMPNPIISPARPETALLHCALCQRRIGLWAFIKSSQPSQQPSRQLDILKEHRSYCPYVVRSTIVPSLPVPQNFPSRSASTFFSPVSSSSPSVTQFHGETGAIEGWRAVLTVVLRHRNAQRQRFGMSSMERMVSPDSGESVDVPMEQDEVEAMVAGVKSHGGRDLLRYVKGLLG